MPLLRGLPLPSLAGRGTNAGREKPNCCRGKNQVRRFLLNFRSTPALNEATVVIISAMDSLHRRRKGRATYVQTYRRGRTPGLPESGNGERTLLARSMFLNAGRYPAQTGAATAH